MDAVMVVEVGFRTSVGHHFIFQSHLPSPGMSRLINPAPVFLMPASHLAGWCVGSILNWQVPLLLRLQFPSL